jgi:superfamily II DNA or RNA helicase
MRGVVSVVTGAGKTVFAEMCMVTFQERFPNGRVIVLVPTLALLDQWFLSLRDELGVPEEDMALYSGESHPPVPLTVNIMVLNTARDHIGRVAGGIDSFLIVDECHKAGSPQNARALEGDYTATLGMSATPERDYDDDFETRVVPALGEIIYRYDYEEARREGVIAPFELVHVHVHLLEKEELEYARLTRLIGRLKPRDRDFQDDPKLKRLLIRRAMVTGGASLRIPTAVALVEQHRGARTIIFHERIEAADKIYAILLRRKVNATIYHTSIGPALRRDNLRLFRAGIFDALVCCRALDEGINVPEAHIGIIASSTASTRQRIQRLGRILRPSPGKAYATVYTLYATDAEEERLHAESLKLADVASTTWMQSINRA